MTDTGSPLEHGTTRARLRDLGIAVGRLETGPLNAITDVGGVRVGFSTLIADAPRILRTGVTAIWPAEDIWQSSLFAGCFSFNGNGEMTGAQWLAEQGLLGTPIAITNSHSVGLVRDAIGIYAGQHGVDRPWMLPIVTETYDGFLSVAESYPIGREMVFAALDAAAGGPVAEGNVGGGAGSVCHWFKGGTGTSSRLVEAAGARWTVGALVQANYGERHQLTLCGVPVGRELDLTAVPLVGAPVRESGSLVAVLATDAPLLPIQCQRLARRAAVGLARVGGIGANSSGDLFVAFSTANRVPSTGAIHDVRMTDPEIMTDLFEAAAEATEEAILNAITMAETTTGRDGRIAYALPLDRLSEIMARHRAR